MSVEWLYAYVAVWAGTLGGAVLVDVAGGHGVSLARRALGLQLEGSRHPPPALGQIVALAAHNITIAAWPLLLGVLGAERDSRTRHAADWVIAACLLANAAPVGAALAAYGLPLIPYLPQLPLEWAGIALGAGSWLTQRRRAISASERIVWLALISGVLLCAAVLEAAGTPHRGTQSTGTTRVNDALAIHGKPGRLF